MTPVTRRTLMQALAAAPIAAAAKQTNDRLILSAPLTHSDWMLRPGVEWGEAGVRHMLDACRDCGWSRIYWRALDSGRALYRSRLRDPMGSPLKDSIFSPTTEAERAWTAGMTAEARADLLRKMAAWDYAHFDSLGAAVSYGHKIGVEIHAWLTLNEDDHGWGWPSRYTLAHPESRWRRRDGTFYRSQQSFAFAGHRRHKLAIVEEVVRNYKVDGVFIDWLRTGDVRDNPQTDAEGVANYGYEEPLLRGFRRAHGVDARSIPNGDDRWVRYRAEPQTVFMRSVRRLIRAARPRIPLSVMVAHPWCYRGLQNKIDGNLRGMLLDVETWASEGLIDEAVAAGYYMSGGSPELATRALQAQLAGKAQAWLYCWVPETPDGFEADLALARKLGVPQMLFWEADYIDGRANREELQRAMRARARVAASREAR